MLATTFINSLEIYLFKTQYKFWKIVYKLCLYCINKENIYIFVEENNLYLYSNTGLISKYTPANELIDIKLNLESYDTHNIYYPKKKLKLLYMKDITESYIDFRNLRVIHNKNMKLVWGNK